MRALWADRALAIATALALARGTRGPATSTVAWLLAVDTGQDFGGHRYDQIHLAAGTSPV